MAENKQIIELDEITSLEDSDAFVVYDMSGSSTIRVSKNNIFSDYVPYSGATGDVDLGLYDLQATQLRITDTSTYIDKDGSNNMTFTDAVSGTWALADLIGGAAPDGRTWVAPVLDKDLTSPPVSPEDGDRYLLLGTGEWYDSRWLYRKKFTLAAAKIAATELGFIMRLNIEGGDDEVFDSPQEDGDDFVVTASDGITKIPHYIKTYDRTNQVLEILCKTDVVAATDEEVYLYYGNSTCDNQEDIKNVFRSDYGCFYPITEDGAATTDDKTTNNRDIISLSGTLTPTATIDGFGGGLTGSADGAASAKDITYWEQQWSTRTHRIIVKTPETITGTRPTLFAEGGATNGILLYAFNDGGGYKLYARWWSKSQGWAGDHQLTDATLSGDTVYVIDMTFDYTGINLYALRVNGATQDTPANPGAYINAHPGDGGIFYTGRNHKNYHDGNTSAGNYSNWTIYYLALMDNYVTENEHINFYNNWGDYSNSVTVGDEEEFGAGLTGDWAGHKNEIAEWNGDTEEWDFPTASPIKDGTTTNVVDENAIYSYDLDTDTWAIASGVVNHLNLLGVLPDTNHQYHLTLNQYTEATREATQAQSGLMPPGKLDNWDYAYEFIINSRYKLNFVVDDWDLDGDYYKIDIEHELGEEHPQIEIYDGDDKVILDVVNVDADNLTIKVTADPDSRFDGIISIIRS